jgi:RNA polymerase sigma-70 factor (ECF subfamily)
VSEYPELDGIMDGIRARDEGAFAVAYRQTADPLASFANGIVHDRGFAEDAVQQAFLELVKASPSIEGDGRSLRAWLFRSVRFSCLDELRRRSRRPEALTDRPPEPRVSPESELDAADPALISALQQLSERQRSLLALKHIVGLGGNEIAEVIGGNRAAIYAATARAERHLRKLLSDRTPEGPHGQI